LQSQADVVIVEGAGGFRVPINRQETMADLAIKLNLPIILVVGIRLGCINHALMTASSIRAAGLDLVGWVANRVDPNMPALEENIATLKAMIKAPCIADVAWGAAPYFVL
jgi:dethiobiotin synthetase